MELRTPDNLFPMDVAKNQPPIIKEVNRGGLNFDTSESPIGLKKSSPIVITAYDEINHHGEAFAIPLLFA